MLRLVNAGHRSATDERLDVILPDRPAQQRVRLDRGLRWLLDRSPSPGDACTTVSSSFDGAPPPPPPRGGLQGTHSLGGARGGIVQIRFSRRGSGRARRDAFFHQHVISKAPGRRSIEDPRGRIWRFGRLAQRFLFLRFHTMISQHSIRRRAAKVDLESLVFLELLR